MPVVVDQRKASFPAVSVVMKCNFPITLKTAVHPPKLAKALIMALSGNPTSLHTAIAASAFARYAILAD